MSDDAVARGTMSDDVVARDTMSGAAAAGGPAPGMPGSAGPWCDRCGGALTTGDHSACAEARLLEPPRFCRACRRRMKVQVLPAGWRATCVEHGESGS